MMIMTTNVIHCVFGVGMFTEDDLFLLRISKCNVKMRKEKHRHHIIMINIFCINIISQWRKWLIEEVWQVQPLIPIGQMTIQCLLFFINLLIVCHGYISPSLHFWRLWCIKFRFVKSCRCWACLAAMSVVMYCLISSTATFSACCFSCCLIFHQLYSSFFNSMGIQKFFPIGSII